MRSLIAVVYEWILCSAAASNEGNRKLLSMQLWFQDAGNTQAESLEVTAEATIGDLERGIRHAMGIDDKLIIALSFGGKSLLYPAVLLADEGIGSESMVNVRLIQKAKDLETFEIAEGEMIEFVVVPNDGTSDYYRKAFELSNGSLS